MNGDGEGMVAIIQALRDAGLAVTLMDGRYQRLLHLEQQARDQMAVARILALNKSLEVPQVHSSTETRMMDKSHRSAQICDGRYASSYQMAHCNMSLTSPQMDSPEFPPQRASPNATEGNFVVGGYRNGEAYTRVRGSQSYRSSMAWQDRGFLYVDRPSHTLAGFNRSSSASEAFVYSLRKYPSISPERSGSAEMVQRLINYTQSKYSKKKSYQSKSMRSLHDTNNKSDKQTPRRSCKNIQTYTRSGSNSPVKKNYFNDNNNEEKRSMNYRLRSPASDCRNVRYKDAKKDQFNETYDYLKYNAPAQRKLYRTSEVRYMSDVTKCLRDTLKHICEDKPAVCQKIMNRYTNHERQHHPERLGFSCDHHRSRVDSVNTEVQASPPTISSGAIAFDSKNVYTDSPSPSCSNSSNCKRNTSFIICTCPNKIIDDVINKWVQTIPINSAESHSDRKKREDLIKSLAFKLKDVVNDDDFDDKSRYEIENCVNDIPIWNAGNEREQDALKNHIVENLYNKIRNLNSKEVIKEMMNKKNAHLKDKNYQGNDFVQKQVDDDLIIKIKPSKAKETGQEKVFNAVKKEIADSVYKLPLVMKGTKSETVNGIATKLTDVIATEQEQNKKQKALNKITIKDDEKRRQNEFNYARSRETEKKTQEEFNNIRIKEEVNNAVFAEVKNLIGEWSTNIVNLQSSIDKNRANEDIVKQLLEIKTSSRNIEDKINQLPIKLPRETIDQIAAKIAEILVKEHEDTRKEEESNRARCNEEDNKGVCEDVKKLLKDWGHKITNLQSTIDKNKAIDELTQQLLEIKSTNMHIEDMISHIKRFLETTTLQNLDVRSKNEISNILIEKVPKPETLLDDKARRIREQEHLYHCRQRPQFNIVSQTEDRLDEENDIYSQRTATPSIVRQTSPQMSLRESFEQNSSNDSKETRKKDIINIPSQKIRRMEAVEDDDEISYSQNVYKSPKQKLRTYYKDKRSLIEDIPDIEIGVDEKKQIDQLIKRIQEIQTQGIDQDIILDEIDDWLDTLSKKMGVDIPMREREAIAKKLLEYLEINKPRKRWDQSDNKHKTFLNDISNLIDTELVRFSDSHKRGNNDKKVRIIERSTNEIEENLTETHSEDLKDAIREELKEMLAQYKVGITNEELEDMISHVLADQIMRGSDSHQSRGKVYSMLQEDNIPKNIAADISIKLADRVKEMSLGFKAQDSIIVFNRPKRVQTGSPFHKETFKSNAERVILDFIDEYCNDSNFVKQTKVKKSTKELVTLIADILLEPDENTEDLLNGSIWEYINNISFQSDTPILDLVDELAERISNIVINASTPRKDKRSIQSKQDGPESSKEDKLKNFVTSTKDNSKRYNNENGSNTADLCPCDAKKLEKDYTEKLTKIISNWIENLPINIAEKLKNSMTKDLISDILDRQKYLQLNPTTKTSDREELENLKYQVYRWLHNLPGVQDFFSFMSKTEDLMQRIKRVYRPVLIKDAGKLHSGPGSKITEETFDVILEEWFANLPLRSRKTCLEIIEMEKLKAQLKCRLEHLRMSSYNERAMRKEIRKLLFNFPLDSEKNNDGFINEKVNELMELLESIPCFKYSGMDGDNPKSVHIEDSSGVKRTSLEDIPTSRQANLSLQSISPAIGSRKPCNILFDYIMAWFGSLRVTTDNIEQAKTLKYLKQSLASQLISKIGEMNINQDLFDDDYLYEEIMKDEIDSLLNELPISDELQNELQGLKENLIIKIMEVREKTKQEIAGQQYKRTLRDIISKSLPLQSSTDSQDVAALDVLKDNLADAFMNLHFYGADDELKEKYKKKIKEEITKFCEDYLNRYPDTPIDSEILNIELFDALRENVEIPNDEIIRREIEQARIRDDINDWIRDIPLKGKTQTELLQRNKMIALLAKKLHDIETDCELDDSEINNKMEKEILKFLEKLPLNINDDKSVNTCADKLIDTLNISKSSRRHSVSNTLPSLREADTEETTIGSWNTIDSNINYTTKHKGIMETSRKEDNTLKQSIQNKGNVESPRKYSNLSESVKSIGLKPTSRSSYIPSIPPSTLSTADRAHLEEIRERTFNSSNFTPSSSKRDAAVNPLPEDVACQTDVIPATTEKASKTPDSLVKRPKSPRATCPSQEIKCPSPAAQLFRYKNQMQQDVSIDSTEIGGSQEMRSTSPDPYICSGPCLFDNEKNPQQIESFEFQQQTDPSGLLIPAHLIPSPQVAPVNQDINQTLDAQESICPGIIKKSDCYNKTCPSLSQFVRQELNENVGSTLRDIKSSGQNAVAGPSRCEIAPHVIIKEYYWGPPDQVNNKPQRQSCLSINSRANQTIANQGSQCQDINRQSEESTSYRNGYNNCFKSNIRCPMSARWRYEEFSSRPTQTCSNVNFRSNRNFRRNEWVSDDENDFLIDNDVNDDEELHARERIKKEEKLRCRCREKVVTKCRARFEQRCPHPSCLYFR